MSTHSVPQANRRDGAGAGTNPSRLSATLDAVRRLPRAGWLCALVALLSAIAWSLVTPAFMVPDEQAHYAYAEYVAEHGRPPAATDRGTISTEQREVTAALKTDETVRQPQNIGVWSKIEQERLDAVAHSGLAQDDGNGYSISAGPQPPLYYAIAAIPYRIASNGTLVQRLWLMRIVSTLLAAATALLVFLFLREVLPGTPWAWPIGALAVALHPLFSFMSGGVNPDALLFASAAALFYALARAFRRGVTPTLAVVVGGVLAIGLLGKLNLVGLVPAGVVGIAVAARREGGGTWSRALGLTALTCAVMATPLVVFMALNLGPWDRPALGLVTNASAVADISWLDRLNYVWQLYLPRLPGTATVFSISPIADRWWLCFVGYLGPLDALFSDWVYLAAIVPFGLVVLLATRALFLLRARIAARRWEIAIYALAVLGMLGVVAAQSLATDREYGLIASGGQLRYLFPLLPLYGALVALAARGAGRRWGPAVGVLLVALALGHDIAGQLLVISRYYS